MELIFIRSSSLALGLLMSIQGLAGAQAASHGAIANGTYIDSRFGMRYSIPSSLEPQSSVNGMPVGTGEKVQGSEFLLDAMEKITGSVRSGVFITADHVGSAGTTDPRQFLKLVVATGMGVKGELEIQQSSIAGRTFFRSNASVGTTVRSYGAQLVTTCNGQFLAFYFSASSPEKVEKLVHSMDKMQLTCSADSR